MDRIKVSENFYLDEFVTPKLLEEHGEKAADFFDARLIEIAQFCRDKSGKSVMINNWKTGGTFSLRGVRPPESKLGAKYSQHKYVVKTDGTLERKCQAIDINIGSMTGKQMHGFVREHAAELFALGVRRIEDYTIATGWLHIDLKSHKDGNAIQIVDLKRVTGLINF